MYGLPELELTVSVLTSNRLGASFDWSILSSFLPSVLSFESFPSILLQTSSQFGTAVL
jgi:hypothetical protein